jgi:hypothetical protein
MVEIGFSTAVTISGGFTKRRAIALVALVVMGLFSLVCCR